MKPFSSILTVLMFIASVSVHANESATDYIPLNYNSAGLETDAQKAIEDRDADFVENQYQDLDQDGVQDKIDLCPNTIFKVSVDQHGCELDSDKDGVFDRLDQCPGTAPGVKVNVFGCEGDEDNDGVVDSKDQCPGTPEGTPVDSVGCKLIGDSDKDGVNDADDQCPDTPANTKVNEYGCIPVAFVLSNIHFDSAKHDIREDQISTLKGSAASLQTLKADEVVLITGHTDWQSKQPFNLRLSWRRAASTKAFIIEAFNYAPEVLYIHGKGELEPVADNRSEEGRFQNRRIEFKIMSKDALPADAQLVIPQAMTKY